MHKISPKSTPRIHPHKMESEAFGDALLPESLIHGSSRKEKRKSGNSYFSKGQSTKDSRDSLKGPLPIDEGDFDLNIKSNEEGSTVVDRSSPPKSKIEEKKGRK